MEHRNAVRNTLDRRDVAACVAFFLGVLVLRMSSFFLSVIDPDESLYLLVSRTLLEGGWPYVDIWDNKPVGVYILFTGAQMIVGETVLSIRILGWITVSTTSCLLYFMGKKITDGSRGAGLVAGSVYAIFSVSNGGLASNTEILLSPVCCSIVYDHLPSAVRV